jgi:NTP pyrophosphatase (non-canonical NTP hydrolase)
MDFQEFQRKALETDQVPDDKIVPLLGLAGETGELLSEYKKFLRDGDAHTLFKDRIAEELGDLLWYISNAASKFDLNLDEIATGNLEKTRDRWVLARQTKTERGYSFDEGYPQSDRIPRTFTVIITDVEDGDSIKMKAFVDGQQIGDDLTDNAYSHDGYRFHDVFHLSYAAVLGWSPVTRMMLKRKRKSNPTVDEVEDGGRAKAIEEGVAALVFQYADDHDFLKDIGSIDYTLLKIIKSLTSRLEVALCSVGDWEKAILMGFGVWREVTTNKGGIVKVDLDAQTISYEGCVAGKAEETP